MINITVEGPDRAGKGYIIAAISRALAELGCVVSVQGAETHNAKKLSKDDAEITARLKDTPVRIMEMQTSK